MSMSMPKYNFIGNRSSISSNLVAIKCCYCFFSPLIILKFLSSQDHRKVESRLDSGSSVILVIDLKP